LDVATAKVGGWKVGEVESWRVEEFVGGVPVSTGTGRDPCAERAENHPQMSGDEEKLETAA